MKRRDRRYFGGEDHKGRRFVLRRKQLEYMSAYVWITQFRITVHEFKSQTERKEWIKDEQKRTLGSPIQPAKNEAS